MEPEKFLRRMAPQAIIILILTIWMVVGALIFQYLDEVLAKQSFYEVIFFEFVTISTIGYGNQYPMCRASRMFSLIFAMFGIPLLLVTLGNFAKYLTKFYWKATGKILHQKTEKQLVNDTNIPGLAIIALYLMTSGVGFMFIPHSGAPYTVDDFYFSVISFATVGLGDMTPQIDTFQKFVIVLAYLLWGTTVNIILISFLSTFFTNVIYSKPHKGGDEPVYIQDTVITVSEITSLVAQHFQASPHQVREMLKNIDCIMEDIKRKKELKEEEEEGGDGGKKKEKEKEREQLILECN